MRIYSLDFQESAGALVQPGADDDPLIREPDGSIRVEVDPPGKRPSDFCFVFVPGLPSTGVSDRAKRILEPVVGGDATFIPMQAGVERYWGLLVTREGPVDLEASSTSRDMDGNLQFDRVVYLKDELSDYFVFCRPGDHPGTSVYFTDGFLELVLKHGLTGIDPYVIWDSDERIWRPTRLWPDGPPAAKPPAEVEEAALASVMGETPLSQTDRQALAELAPVGYDLIGCTPYDAPARIGEAVEEALNRLHDLARQDEMSRKDTMALGVVIGESTRRAAGWEWVRLNAEGDSILAVVSPDRARYLEPIAWAAECVEEGVHGSVVGLIAGIEHGLRLPGAPGEYWPLP